MNHELQRWIERLAKQLQTRFPEQLGKHAVYRSDKSEDEDTFNWDGWQPLEDGWPRKQDDGSIRHSRK
jgi:hypothetical protein